MALCRSHGVGRVEPNHARCGAWERAEISLANCPMKGGYCRASECSVNKLHVFGIMSVVYSKVGYSGSRVMQGWRCLGELVRDGKGQSPEEILRPLCAG